MAYKFSERAQRFQNSHDNKLSTKALRLLVAVCDFRTQTILFQFILKTYKSIYDIFG